MTGESSPLTASGSSWIPVCRLDEIPDGRGLALDRIRIGLSVFHVEGQVYALLGRCPHAGGVMGNGWIEEGAVVCPLHLWRFRLTDGHCVSPYQGPGLQPLPCEVRDEMVHVELTDQTPHSGG